jgi:hypothetical protein
MPTIDINQGHESRNIGKEPIDLAAAGHAKDERKYRGGCVADEGR